jgi:hypothetical protein
MSFKLSSRIRKVGSGVGVAVGSGVAVGIGLGVAVGVSVTVGVGVAVAVGVGVGDAVGSAVAVEGPGGDGDGSGADSIRLGDEQEAKRIIASISRNNLLQVSSIRPSAENLLRHRPPVLMHRLR